MKKIWLVLLGLFWTVNVTASEFINGQHYITLDKAIPVEAPIVEFFSFYCPHCYQFEQIWPIGDVVRKNLPHPVKIIKYHIGCFGGNMGYALTRAWAIAMVMGLENKVTLPIFHGILYDQTVTDEVSLKKVFMKASGIKSAEYDVAWHGDQVEYLVHKQEKIAEYVGLKGVPTMLIYGKYMINNSELDSRSTEVYLQQYSNLVHFLLTKKE
ncbi:DsbA family protein [Candidatus Erwinia haradaeae]|uniref:Thiol:disulfide interchange protein n=1 Tax=Candidatus Erwinia haradaeae TaxID=1922217 RepID=A0A451D7T7_9GAMM|nr:DsbA family protein [Candidatus Erwinia haradaeae]VFP81910.1 Thiol:disulfide interchange protein DsbA [Candidatus Erwinia haradaeae]